MFVTVSSFFIVLTFLFIPYSNIKDKVEAITDMTGDPSITVTSTNDTANVMIEPTTSGAFMSTSGNGDIAFSVSTSNYTGYELSVSSTKTTLDYSTFSLSSITSDVTEEQFSASANTQYNNKWGYKPSFYNSLANTKYYGITTSSVVLDQTNAANSTANNYSISVGARANLNTPAGTYSNDNIVLTTVANTVPSSILTVNYSTGVSSITIAGQTIPDGETVKLIQGVPYTITMTPSTDYAFSSWSATDGTVTSASTQSTTYTIDTNDATLTTGTSFIGPDIQNLAQSDCTTTPSLAKDTRDDHIYTIQRLADGNCWMMENLDLGRTALTTDLTSSNTNLSSTITAATFNSWINTSGSMTYDAGVLIPVDGTDTRSNAPYGTLYNYYAASVGTISGSTNRNNALYDLCPAGWRLPTGGNSAGEFYTLYTLTDYNTYDKMRASVANGGAAFALAGTFGVSNPYNQSVDGQYWSSTWSDNQNRMMYNLLLNSSGFSSNSGYRATGYSIRCIRKKQAHSLTISYGADVSSVKVNTIEIQNGGTVNLEEGVSYPITVTPATGYSFSSWSATSGTIGSTNMQSTTYTISSSNATLTATTSPNNYTCTKYYRLENADGTYPSTYTTSGTEQVAYGSTCNYTQTETDYVTQSTSGVMNSTSGIKLYLDLPRNTYVLTINKNSTYISSVTGAGTYRWGQQVSISATASSGNEFTSWSQTSGTTGTFGSATSASTTFTMGKGAATIYANGQSSGPTISSLTYLQDFRNLSASDKTSVKNSMSYNTTYNLIDNRDNKTYKVAKLKDNNIWLAENLDLGRTTISTNLTSTNTNISTTVNASTFNGWIKSVSSATYTSAELIPVSGTDSTSGTPYGTLYNYCAASAGTICVSSNSSDASYDICPAGWRLPIGGYSGEFQALYGLSDYNSTDKLCAPIASGGAAFAHGGMFSYNDPPSGQGNSAGYWSSRNRDGTDMYFLSISPAVNAVYYYPRNTGFSVRCIVK